jgi:hypothetical protein
MGRRLASTLATSNDLRTFDVNGDMNYDAVVELLTSTHANILNVGQTVAQHNKQQGLGRSTEFPSFLSAAQRRVPGQASRRNTHSELARASKEDKENLQKVLQDEDAGVVQLKSIDDIGVGMRIIFPVQAEGIDNGVFNTCEGNVTRLHAPRAGMCELPYACFHA